MLVIGYISARSPENATRGVAAFRGGLAEGGFAEGKYVAIELRWGFPKGYSTVRTPRTEACGSLSIPQRLPGSGSCALTRSL